MIIGHPEVPSKIMGRDCDVFPKGHILQTWQHLIYHMFIFFNSTTFIETYMEKYEERG